MELTEEAKAEIREAIKILREDGVHIHRTYAAFQKTLESSPEDKPAENEPTEGKPPPVIDKPPVEEKPKKKGLGVWQ